MVETQLVVRSEVGLHARPAELFVRAANRFQSEIRIRNMTTDSPSVDAKSILLVLSLGVYSGHTIQLNARGIDEDQAIRAIADLVENNFGNIRPKP